MSAFPVTFGLLAAMLLLYGFAAARAPLSTHVPTETLFGLGACQADLLVREPWRVLTAAFLHADLAHLACNGFGVLLLLPRAEQRFGSPRAWIVFCSCAVGGSLVSELPRLVLEEPHATVGASGGLCGLLGALYASHRRAGELEPARQLRDWAFLIAVVSFVPGVNGLAHLGGGACGALWGLGIRGPGHPVWTACGILLAGACLAAFAAVASQ